MKLIYLAIGAAVITLSSSGFAFMLFSGSPATMDGSGSRGSSWGDVNNDGLEDLFIANRQNQHNILLINKTTDPSRPVFEPVSESPVIMDGGDSQGSAFADFDNDGDLDLYVANRRNQKNFFYINEGNGSVIKAETGDHVTDTFSSTSISWVDVDNDGFLDLFVANRNNQPNSIYINNRNGGFTKLSTGAIVTDAEDTRAAAWGDLDGNGFQDLVAGNANGPTSVYLNQGNRNFKKWKHETLTADSGYTYGVSIQDINNDQLPDIFVVNLYERNELFVNRGNMSFEKVTGQAIAEDESYSKGIVWQDFDNDGDLDVFVSNGTFGLTDDNFFYRNEGDNVFTAIKDLPVTKHGGLAGGASSSDINRDGRIDLYVTNWVDNANNRLFFNVTDRTEKNWIQLRLVGVDSPSTPYGSMISVHYKDKGESRSFSQLFNSQSGYASQQTMYLQFGLGAAESVDSVEVQWPSGKTEIFMIDSVNQRYELTENNGKS